jgi:tRNA (guanine37-N1)-methyltransferase
MSSWVTPAGELASRTWVALVHHPVRNRQGRIITTAVTNLDLHDIARASRTYGLAGYLVVTPVERQRLLVERIVQHWDGDHGAGPNRHRAEAISLIRVMPDLQAATSWVEQTHGSTPLRVATAATVSDDATPVSRFLTERATDPRPVLLLFGTGWGLALPVLQQAEIRLGPILGPTDYNHLSVRSAVSIYLDRCFGR